MADIGQTTLSDVIVPEDFNQYVVQQSVELSRFRQSGILVDLTEEIAPKMGGTSVHMPFFNDLTGDADTIDDQTDLTVNSITSGQDVSVILYRGKAFGSSDLAGDLAGSDPMAVIGNRFANFWVREEQKTLLAAVGGQIGASPQNCYDITALTGAAANFDPFSFIDACGRLGDHQDNLAGVAVHSDTYKAMKKMDLIDFIQPSTGGAEIPVYQGKFVIVDDTMPKNSGTGAYVSYIFGPGAIGYATGTPKRPVELERRALVGGGTEYLVHRRMWTVHTRGIKWSPQANVPAKPFPVNAELADSNNWTRVYDPKLIRCVKFTHKLGN